MNCRYERISTHEIDSCKLSVIHSNCQSAMNKRSEVSGLIDSQNPDILALTEFGAANTVNDGELGIEGYSLYRGDHSSGGGGLGRGVALYVKNELNHSPCPMFDSLEFDCCSWCTIKLSDGKKLLVGVVYRSPNSSEENNKKMLDILRIASASNFDYQMVCGDFNIPKIDWNINQCLDTETSYTAEFLEVVEETSWFQHSKSNTRFRGAQSSCLDLVFPNEESMIEEMTELPPLGKSDHACQKWDLTVKEVMFKNTNIRRHNYKRANWIGVKNDIINFSFGQNDSVDKMTDSLIDAINVAKGKHIPLCKPRSIKNRLPWMRCFKVKKQRSRRWKAWTRFKETSLPRDYDAYKMERNRLNDLIREAKRKYEKGLISDLKGNPNLFHGHCQRMLKTKSANGIDGEGKLTDNLVFTKDDETRKTLTLPDQTAERLTDIHLSTELIEEILLLLNPNKAAGPDRVETRVLKKCAEEMAPKLHQLFEKSMAEGDVPAQWKEAHIVPIHKGGSKAKMLNFGLVALTSAICKVLEKIVCAAIMSFLSRNDLISTQQHGFVRGRSCQTNILLCLESWARMLDEGKSIDVAYFDYAKAFDKVSHRLLMIKLQAYGLDGKILAWLETWLNGRRQRVVVGNSMSPWLEVVSGTTQGTVLGFLLFLIYINDLPDKCRTDNGSHIMLLADDTKAFREIGEEEEKQEEDQKALQSQIDNIAQWADSWRMEINPEKSKVMHMGRNNPCLPYLVNGKEIKAVTVEKDIGFWVTDDLSTSTHVHKARNRAMGEISQIKRNFSYIDKQAFCVLYNQRVRPHLDYGMTACPPDSAADAKLLERVQAKATALVQGLKGLNSEERRKRLGLMTLKDRRERGDMIEVFKILKGLTRISPQEFWEVREARNGARLVKELATNGKRQRKGFFSYRVIQTWNLLPADIKLAPSLNSFKNRLDELIMSRN